MKLRSGFVLVVLLGAVLLIHVMLGFNYLNQQEEQSSLTSQIAQVRGRPRSEQQDTLGLQKQVEAAHALLPVLQSRYFDQPTSTVVLDVVQQYARESGVEVLSLQAQPPATEELAENTYQVLPFNLEVEGRLPWLVAFLIKLEHGRLMNLVIGEASVEAAGGADILTLTLNFFIYMPPFPEAMLASTSAPEAGGRLADFQRQIDEARKIDGVWEVGDWEPLIKVLSSIRGTESGSPGVNEMLYLARVSYAGQLIAEGRLEEAAEQFEEALAIEPDGVEAKEGLQRLIIAMGK